MVTRSLAASLAANVALVAAVVLRDPFVGRLRAVLRRPGKDYAALGRRRFTGWTAASTVLLGDSQFDEAPVLDLLGHPVRARAISGARLADALLWIDGVIADSPARVVVFLGSNDAYFREPLPASEAAAVALLDRLRDVPSVSVVAVPPIVGRDAEVAAVNGVLQRLARERGFDWVDLHAALAGSDWSTDDVHLTGASYRVLGELLRLG